MRISDWSSDVCSSDLARIREAQNDLTSPGIVRRHCWGRRHGCSHKSGGEREIQSLHCYLPRQRDTCTYHGEEEREASKSNAVGTLLVGDHSDMVILVAVIEDEKIGRASCRERVGQYV